MSVQKFLAGFAVGAAIGAVAGILLAPKSGAETKQISKGREVRNGYGPAPQAGGGVAGVPAADETSLELVSSSDGRRHELGAGRCRSRVPRQPSPRPLAARSSGGWLMSLRRESGAEQTVVARGCRGEGWAPPRRRQPPHRCPSRTHGALQVVRRREGMGERSDGAG